MKTAALTAAAVAAVTVLSGCGQGSDQAKAGAGAVRVEKVLCRPTPTGRDMTACYMVITAPADDRLMSVAAPDAASAQLHEMKTENGMMTMAEIQGGLALPAGQAVALAPGGDHIMLLGLSRPLAEGDSVSLTLGFETSEPISVQARVSQPALPGAQ